jgi:uncharacterized protein (DUF697 family)/ethanolamine utilization protein EutP (predicted NTPase)
MTLHPMDVYAEFQEQYAEQMRNVVKPTILVCGYTGTGKSSLIQAVCGKDTVPDDRIGHGKPMTQSFTQYHNDFVNLWDSRGFEPGDREADFLETTRALVGRLQEDRDPRNHIHLVWYTIQGPGARVTPVDIELIRAVFSNVIVCITKNDITRPQQSAAIAAALVESGVAAESIVPVSDEDPASLRKLIDRSMELLPAAYQDAFSAAQIIDLDRKKWKAQAVIHSAATAAAAAALNPLPFSDAALITPIQVGLIASLAVVYGLPTQAVKMSLAPLVAQVAGVLTASSLTKFFPFFGSIIESGVAFALTEVIGQLADAFMVKCYRAKVAGEPLPSFQLPMATLAQLVQQHLNARKK